MTLVQDSELRPGVRAGPRHPHLWHASNTSSLPTYGRNTSEASGHGGPLPGCREGTVGPNAGFALLRAVSARTPGVVHPRRCQARHLAEAGICFDILRPSSGQTPPPHPRDHAQPLESLSTQWPDGLEPASDGVLGPAPRSGCAGVVPDREHRQRASGRRHGRPLRRRLRGRKRQPGVRRGRSAAEGRHRTAEVGYVGDGRAAGDHRLPRRLSDARHPSGVVPPGAVSHRTGRLPSGHQRRDHRPAGPAG
jgi:hypothetical protein